MKQTTRHTRRRVSSKSYDFISRLIKHKRKPGADKPDPRKTTESLSQFLRKEYYGS